MNKVLFFILIVFLLLAMNLTGLAQEGDEEETDKMKDDLALIGFGAKKESKYYRNFYESFYKEDLIPEASLIKNEEIRSLNIYFRVSYNEKKKPDTIGYYTTKRDKEAGIAVTKLTQYVSMDGQPFYLIKYEYDDRTGLLRTKTYKGLRGGTVGYYEYTWDEKTKMLTKLERYGLTSFLHKMELKSFFVFKWKEGNLVSLKLFNKRKLPIERYVFVDGLNVKEKQSLKPDFKELAIGNLKIDIRYLKMYERFRVGSTQERTYYIKYEFIDNRLIERIFNDDNILLEEKVHSNIPKVEEDSETLPPTE